MSDSKIIDNPHDPSLGDTADREKLANAMKIAELQAPADVAQSQLNSLITLKRSIDMTVQEMLDMGINAEELMQESKAVDEEINKAAIVYGKARIDAKKAICPLKAKIPEVQPEIESPTDDT
jgi:uncharacterized coiled-coil DUF342 family protein